MAAPLLFSFPLPVCNARYIYIYLSPIAMATGWLSPGYIYDNLHDTTQDVVNEYFEINQFIANQYHYTPQHKVYEYHYTSQHTKVGLQR